MKTKYIKRVLSSPADYLNLMGVVIVAIFALVEVALAIFVSVKLSE